MGVLDTRLGALGDGGVVEGGRSDVGRAWAWDEWWERMRL